jgi:hypothetical protein
MNYAHPSFILIVITIVAWRLPAVGGILFIAFGYFAISFTVNRYMLFMALPPMIVGLLFLGEGLVGWTYDDIEQKIPDTQKHELISKFDV